MRSEGGANDAVGRGVARTCAVSDRKLCYTVPEAAEMLGVSRNFGYELTSRGEIPTDYGLVL